MRWLLTSISFAPVAIAGIALFWPAPATDRGPACDRVAQSAPPSRQAAAETMAPVRFVPNVGQWHDAVRFAALGDTNGWLHDDGFSLRFERWTPRPAGFGCTAANGPATQSGCVVRTRFLGGDQPEFVPGAALGSTHHFFLGNDPSRWRPDVPSYASVCMRGVLPGIDVVFRPLPAGRRGPFEYDLVLAPGADLSRFAARCEGVESLRVDADGRLCATIETPDGQVELVQDTPVAWQDTPTGRAPLRVAFRLLGTRSYGFVAADLDPAFSATVDPGVLWGTFLGGGASDSVNDLHWKPGSGIWVAGWAGSTDFPTTVGAYRTTGGSDAFLARLNESGTALSFATYLGGSQGEEIRGLDLGPGDTATVVGFTASSNFPTTPGALQTAYGGASQLVGIGDGFLARFSASGNALLGATYVGGYIDDVVEDVAVDASGNALITGFTYSPSFPTTPGCWQSTFASLPGADSDGFVARISPNAQTLLFSTFVGGLWSDQLLEVDVDALTGDAVVCGWSTSPNYPTTPNAYRTTAGGVVDAVVTRLTSNGSAPVFSSFLGGIESEIAHGVMFAADGSVWVGGSTNSPNFPTTLNAPQRTQGGFYDGFLSRLSANGQTLLFSTLLGGGGVDSVRAIDVHADGVVAVGDTGPGFPVTADAIQGQFAGGNLDAFVAYLTAGGTVLSYASYIGGTNQDFLTCVDIDASGLVVVGGSSFSADMPIAPAGLQSTRNGVQDGVVMKLDLVSSLGFGFTVASAPTPPPESFVAAGEHELLALTVENLAPRDLFIDALRLLVAGCGPASLSAQSLRIYLSQPGQPTVPPVLVAGPFQVPLDDAEFEVQLVGALLPPHSTADLRIVGDVQPAASGATIEIACAIVDAEAWTLRAVGVGAGPALRVQGTGRAEGPLLVAGRWPGDDDGDALRTVYDLRRQVTRLGSPDPASDCDGDNVITLADVVITQNALLGRPTVLSTPGAVAAGQWFTLTGVFPGPRVLEASLGGRSLVQGRVTQREITLRVDALQAKGTQDMVVVLDGRQIFAGSVLVQ